ncbi:hypothetical protein COS59_01795 [Candidatus Wolfebacteria bacterium CG03_land_8_20_14_0_80_36_15]|uniref:HTH HARE-type domain-containing protein n=1 Tax=Candidatus Wolfebacteria bacterium CG03_land_8_20_14_0_80_36_15 TaxID=1975067 RepID=A0A2M7B7I9_9BACT|nr:MAG: hypothetical protein COS59_01795 [Candidatus Wolfebacteria bacterium CG03_land_8_20_14_0_80_36_15]
MSKDLKQIIQNLLKDLSPRQKEILEGRFGLKEGKMTLASLGEKLGLTRERIRQIENGAIAEVRKEMLKDKEIENLSKVSVNFIKNLGGIHKEDIFVNDFKGLVNDQSASPEQIRFLFEVFGSISYQPEDDDFRAFYYTDKRAIKRANTLSNKFTTLISKKKEELMTKNILGSLIQKIIKSAKISEFVFLNYLSISKKFRVNPYGDFGLVNWEEILPKTMRAKAFLVAKKAGKPLHFKEIAELINKISFDNKKAHYQTVHNELIKDPRFVLVGRGMYSLAEFGYQPGTAKEVISSVLKKHGPLPSKEIIDLVKQQRFLKENTIIINLNNKKYFRKLNDGRYHLVEKA